jgi:dihydroxy-acid dehydratase
MNARAPSALPVRRKPEELRSRRWFGPDDVRSFGHRSRLKQMGYGDEDYQGKPVIAILNTWSELNTCHSHLRQRAEEVKRGVWQAGGFPVEVPVVSLGEMFMKPTTMLYRNLLAMETEEVLRCHPVDGAVLLGGCDKTVPGLLMGAITVDLPVIYMPAGPMLKARWRTETLGSGTDVWKYWAERCAGKLGNEEWQEIENCIGRSAGVCMTMGTASTMASVIDALGMTLPGASSIPAVVAEHSRLATDTGRRICDMVWEDLKPSDILSAESFDNAIMADMSIGGSTNAIVHLIAMARRAGVALDLNRFDQLSRTTPVIGNIRPSGQFLMEDLYNAGGLRALLLQLQDLLNLDCLTVSGRTLGENIEGARVYNEQVILPRDKPLSPSGGTFVLRGNLAPDGCVIKPVAAEKRLLSHTGPAVVFDDYNDMDARLNDPTLEVTADSVIVLRSAGPQGAPGFPEWGMLPIPTKLLEQGVRDMVRISDARMSGTSYGTCVLHVSPESHIGGPLALVQTGDLIKLDVEARQLELLVDESEMTRRRDAWQKPEPKFTRGYGWIYTQYVTQAHEGCDFTFLHGGPDTSEPEIH